MAVSTRRPLTAGDWTRAALDAIVEGGVPAVAVEPLARKLQTSKGSFYWHFRDRAALLESALALWEDERTEAIIREAARKSEPRERLRRVLQLALANPVGGRIEAALIAYRSDPTSGPFLQRITERRLAWWTHTMEELGFATPEARRRGLMAYSMLLGYYGIRDAGGAVPDKPEVMAAFIDDAVEILTARP